MTDDRAATATVAAQGMVTPGPDPMKQFIDDLFGEEGATVFIELINGDEHSGELLNVVLGRGSAPIGVRIATGGGDKMLIPWHSVLSYVVRPY